MIARYISCCLVFLTLLVCAVAFPGVSYADDVIVMGNLPGTAIKHVDSDGYVFYSELIEGSNDSVRIRFIDITNAKLENLNIPGEFSVDGKKYSVKEVEKSDWGYSSTNVNDMGVGPAVTQSNGNIFGLRGVKQDGGFLRFYGTIEGFASLDLLL